MRRRNAHRDLGAIGTPAGTPATQPAPRFRPPDANEGAARSRSPFPGPGRARAARRRDRAAGRGGRPGGARPTSPYDRVHPRRLSPAPRAASSSPASLAGRHLAHRLVNDVPVVPLRLRFEVLQQAFVLTVHLRAIRVFLVRRLAVEDDAEPDLVRVLGAAKDRVVYPAFWRRVLELLHVRCQLLVVPGLHAVPGDRVESLCHRLKPPAEDGSILGAPIRWSERLAGDLHPLQAGYRQDLLLAVRVLIKQGARERVEPVAVLGQESHGFGKALIRDPLD